jgi:hypothetical protein
VPRQLHRERSLGSRPGDGRPPAEALDVPLRERTLLLLAAGYAPAYEESDLDDPRIDPIRNRSSGFSPGTVPTRRSSPIAMATSSPEARRSGH